MAEMAADEKGLVVARRRKAASSVRLATALATLMSVGALSACFVMGPLIYSEVQNLWRELDEDMDSFKVGVSVSGVGMCASTSYVFR